MTSQCASSNVMPSLAAKMAANSLVQAFRSFKKPCLSSVMDDGSVFKTIPKSKARLSQARIVPRLGR